MELEGEAYHLKHVPEEMELLPYVQRGPRSRQRDLQSKIKKLEIKKLEMKLKSKKRKFMHASLIQHHTALSLPYS